MEPNFLGSEESVTFQAIGQTMISQSPGPKWAERETGGWVGVFLLEDSFWKSQTSVSILP